MKSLPPWRDLDEQERDLNRASADDIAIKLEHIGARIVPAFDDSPPLTFTSDEVEQLAELEHARWCRTRQDGGWIFGRTRDDEGRRHPDLVPWAQLPHPRREIDRQHVCLIPELLSDVGLKAIRTT